ncbi:hypothetical protein HAX54_017787 [Datura stramonium]|uniref:Uncharacterized protein n=1 Tax=Datura stramonium TaxID=4076 RepID=A0ABS8UND0_DATST|nr:hypothetical protein [Datura stramonium]
MVVSYCGGIGGDGGDNSGGSDGGSSAYNYNDGRDSGLDLGLLDLIPAPTQDPYTNPRTSLTWNSTLNLDPTPDLESARDWTTVDTGPNHQIKPETRPSYGLVLVSSLRFGSGLGPRIDTRPNPQIELETRPSYVSVHRVEVGSQGWGQDLVSGLGSRGSGSGQVSGTGGVLFGSWVSRIGFGISGSEVKVVVGSKALRLGSWGGYQSQVQVSG